MTGTVVHKQQNVPTLHMEAFSAFENSVEMLVVIHTFLFVLYITVSIFVLLRHNFDDFQTKIGVPLFLPSLFTHSTTLILSLAFFTPWVFIVSILFRRQL
jgi:hypothetical protein